MAADPAYLIYEYDLIMTDNGMEKIGGEVPYSQFSGYRISLKSDLYINDKRITNGKQNIIEKISDKKFKIIQIVNIANIKDDVLNVKQKLNSLDMETERVSFMDQSRTLLDVNIDQEFDAKVTFENREEKILAQKELPNGSTLYIEAVKNSKFENFVLARIISAPQTFADMKSKDKEFMIEEPQFAICDQNDNPITFDYIKLEDYKEKVLSDGTAQDIDYSNLNDTDLVRAQQVQLLRLRFEENQVPEKLKILPLEKKRYNDRNDSEYNFYKNEKWYPVTVGEVNITEESTIGGSVTVTKIEETDDKVIIYYDTKGCIPYSIDCVLRLKSPKMNYRSPRAERHKNINSDENQIIFTKSEWLSSGLATEDFENAEDTEFALFYNAKYVILSEKLEFDWSANESEQVAKIEYIDN